MDTAEKLDRQNQKLNKLYTSALKQVVVERKAGGYASGRIPEQQRPIYKHRAEFRASLKTPGKKVYIKLKHPSNKIPGIYQLTTSDVRKWAKDEYRPDLIERKKIGKLVFEVYHGVWHFSPADYRSEATSISMTSPEGEIITYKTIDYDKYGQYNVGKLVEKEMNEPKKNDMRHYKALVNESKKVGWPVRFPRDLTEHDNRELRNRDPELPFGWVLREDGTHLILPENNWNKDEPPSHAVQSFHKSFGGPAGISFYTWDGTALHKNSPSIWGEWMDRQHHKLRGE